MYFLYSLLTAVGIVLLSPYFLIRGLIRGKNVSNLPERLGWKFPEELPEAGSGDSKQGSIWIHAVSVGRSSRLCP